MKTLRLNRHHIAFIDDQDYDLIRPYTWSIGLFGTKLYAQTATGGKHWLMHRLILRPGPGLIAHHDDDNGLNNTRGNLCLVTRAEHNKIHIRNPLGISCRDIFLIG